MPRDWNLAALNREMEARGPVPVWDVPAEEHGDCGRLCECYARAMREEREARQAAQQSEEPWQGDAEEWPELQVRVAWGRLILLGMCVIVLLLAGQVGR